MQPEDARQASAERITNVSFMTGFMVGEPLRGETAGVQPYLQPHFVYFLVTAILIPNSSRLIPLITSRIVSTSAGLSPKIPSPSCSEQR